MNNIYDVNLQEMGKRIRTIRKTQKQTQEAFAETIHISTSYLALLEQGKRTASLDVVAQISKNYNVSVDYLLFGLQAAPSDQNQKAFDLLCQKYSVQEIARALKLAAFYLELSDTAEKSV